MASACWIQAEHDFNTHILALKPQEGCKSPESGAIIL
jgi:hypothetical protein